VEKEQHTKIIYLDITIHRKDKKLDYSIYRKPTQTDIIIPNSSCHPYEHKLSRIKYLLNRLHTYQITRESKQTEENTIKIVLQKNGYSINITTKPIPHNQNIQEDPNHHKTKWAIFTYCGKEVRQITRLFKDTQLRIAFRTRNILSNILKQHTGPINITIVAYI
jgi:CMP-2-keto-3-deoxyoctulosonic acid synthetase